MENKDIAIVLPVYKEEITYFEQISLEQGKKILANYQFVFAVPEKLNIDCYDVRENDVVERFNDDYFASIPGYNRLMKSPEFYQRFSKFKYILIYQLDCFVFEDRLLEWCAKGYDFIGAPFVEIENNEYKLSSVGNGGLSIRKVASAKRALNSFSYIKTPTEFVKAYPIYKKNIVLFPFKFIRAFTFGNNTYHLFNDCTDNEDHFWGEYVDRNFDWYKVPSPEKALDFAFEVTPKELFTMNNSKLPFGCHAWWKYDLEFWKPHIEKFGYKLDKEIVKA